MKDFQRLRAPVHKPTEAITPKKKYNREDNDEELKNALEEYYSKMAHQDTPDSDSDTRDEDSME